MHVTQLTEESLLSYGLRFQFFLPGPKTDFLHLVRIVLLIPDEYQHAWHSASFLSNVFLFLLVPPLLRGKFRLVLLLPIFKDFMASRLSNFREAALSNFHTNPGLLI